jgi:hypothetical protein
MKVSNFFLVTLCVGMGGLYTDGCFTIDKTCSIPTALRFLLDMLYSIG